MSGVKDGAARTPGGEEARARLRAFCRAAGLPVTAARLAVLDRVLGRTDHPDAETLVREFRAAGAPVGRATVYRTLELLVRAGLVARVGHPGRGRRYDPRTEPHDHFACEVCGAVFDLPPGGCSDAVLRRRLAGRGFELRSSSVLAVGRCPDCRRSG